MGKPRAHIFSVAQHALLVEALARAKVPRLDRNGRLAVLLHDAPEYVIGDMISPFKAVIGDSYKAVEKRLLAAIHLRFGLPAKLPESLKNLIKAADRTAAYLEATRLALALPMRRRGNSSAHRRNSLPRLSATISAHGLPGPHKHASANALKNFCAPEAFHCGIKVIHKKQESP
jgi:5'-deoxynucleotidase YfbR-like HD superfamily hydrolase